ncbi:MAG: hypothetical protein VZR95_02330 [Alphaproteobacteria bacterium]
MPKKVNIQSELESFRKDLWRYHLSHDEEDAYVDLRKTLLLAETLPTDALVKRAKQIKPLVRIRHNAVRHYEKVFDVDENTDLLVFTTWYNIGESYLLNFKSEKQIVTHFRRPLIPRGLKKIGEFTCYHSFNKQRKALCPCVEEVLKQLPEDIDIDKISAFEIRFDSANPAEVYDTLLDRYESTIILYALPDGLPKQVKQQPVEYHNVRY